MDTLLAQLSRVSLGHFPTPLEPLDNLSKTLGGPRVWIKRDDATGLAGGGNKTRKLEFLLGEAVAQGANTVITFGAIQSNHARQTAAACAKLGLECHLILGRSVNWEHPQYESSGNILLDKLLNATIHYINPDERSSAHTALLAKLSDQGKQVYTVPTGGSNSMGAFGYVRCIEELIFQTKEENINPGAIFHATASGGTQAGLIAGSIAHGQSWRIVGVNVYDPDSQKFDARIKQLAKEAASTKPLNAQVSENDVIVDHRHLGEGYGHPTAATIEAINLLASSEAIILDPVYSGKGMAGLIDQIRKRELDSIEDVVFVHTGGMPSLFVYENAF